MQRINDLLQLSANLYKMLGEIPHSLERDDFIKNINDMLDKRGELIKDLQQAGFKYDDQNRIHHTLYELDKGIKERLVTVMNAVKVDMNNLQKTKKNEDRYFNPYANVRVMDGMYYDKKK